MITTGYFQVLPFGYDERTRVAATVDGRAVVAHPDQPPVVVDPLLAVIDRQLEIERKAMKGQR